MMKAVEGIKCVSKAGSYIVVDFFGDDREE